MTYTIRPNLAYKILEIVWVHDSQISGNQPSTSQLYGLQWNAAYGFSESEIKPWAATEVNITFFSLRPTFTSVQSSMHRVPMVGGGRGKSGRSNTCKCSPFYSRLASMQTHKRHPNKQEASLKDTFQPDKNS